MTVPYEKRIPRHRLRQVMVSHLVRVKWMFLLAIVGMLGVTATELLSPWPLSIIFDNILLSKPLPAQLEFLSIWAQHDTQRLLLIVSASVAAITFLSGSFAYLQTYLSSRIGYELVSTLRQELFVHLQRLPISFHQSNRRGELITKVTGDAQILREVFTDTGLDFLSNILTLLGMFIVMFFVNWRLSFIPLATFPILFIIFYTLQRKLKQSMKTQRKQEGKLNAHLSENLAAISTVQAFGRERHEIKRFEKQSAKNLAEGIRVARMSSAMTRSINSVSAIGLASVIFVGALEVLDGHMSLGSVLVFVTYVRGIYKPVKQLVKLSSKLTRASVGAQRISEVLELEPEIQDKPYAVKATNLQGEIIFGKVSFRYNEEKKILHNITLRIAPGQRVAIVGASGSGKSTMLSLLLRLYDPQEGNIFIDQVNLRDYERESLRQQIGLVLQDSLLFGASIRENISYGKPDANFWEIKEAARQAHIHDFIMSLPDGYDTVIGELGSTLSGGQRQRIAIARALVKNPAILILDEPTSALDPESSKQVQHTITVLQGNRTVIVITHQLNTVKDFDQILVLKQGRIVERGTHDNLLAKRGVYAELYRLQEGSATFNGSEILNEFLSHPTKQPRPNHNSNHEEKHSKN
jgi:ATP-binding cassette, subfamily B, bacterial